MAACAVVNFNAIVLNIGYLCFWLVNIWTAIFVHSARFSCRMCLLFNIFSRIDFSTCHY